MASKKLPYFIVFLTVHTFLTKVGVTLVNPISFNSKSFLYWRIWIACAWLFQKQYVHQNGNRLAENMLNGMLPDFNNVWSKKLTRLSYSSFILKILQNALSLKGPFVCIEVLRKEQSDWQHKLRSFPFSLRSEYCTHRHSSSILSFGSDRTLSPVVSTFKLSYNS